MKTKPIVFMVLWFWVAGLLVAQPAAPGPIRNIAESKVKGVKVIASSFDPDQHLVRLTFINDSTLRVTAFRGTLLETHADGTTHQSEFGRDFLVMGDVSFQIESKKRPELKELPHHSLYPGETYLQEFSVGDYPTNKIVKVAATLELAVYSDNTAEVVNDKLLQTVVQWRVNNAKWAGETARSARDVMASEGAHPLLQMIESLTAQDPEFNRIELTELRHLQGDNAQTEHTKLLQYTLDYEQKSKILDESSKLKVVAQ